MGCGEFFFFNDGNLGHLEVGGCYGLIWPAVERLGMADNDCVGMVVVITLAQLG
jgi:hypothetical protein